MEQHIQKLIHGSVQYLWGYTYARETKINTCYLRDSGEVRGRASSYTCNIAFLLQKGVAQ